MAENGISNLDTISNGCHTSRYIFSTQELYELGLRFFKENEGHSFHLPYEDKVKLIALTQQAKNGPIQDNQLPPLGAFDVIGKERRSAWSQLGDMSVEGAKQNFTSHLYKCSVGFTDFVNQQRQQEELKIKSKIEEIEESKLNAVKAELELEKENQKQTEEAQRRSIQDALNKQTFIQFRSYAEQQCPANPDQQAVLVKQLQEQHYYQYMQQVYQQQQQMELQMMSTAEDTQSQVSQDQDNLQESSLLDSGDDVESRIKEIKIEQVSDDVEENGSELTEDDNEEVQDLVEHGDHPPHEGHQHNFPEPEEASMWTRKDITVFKETIRSEESDAIIKVGHGETVTIRVPTHQDGTSLYWEFATDSYDIGFGVFFEWVDPEDSQVSVHITDSDEEEEEEYPSDEEPLPGEEGDAEAGRNSLLVDDGPPTSCIIPIYRRDCHEEVYAGSHTYPRQGVYLLKFDNSYSLWRSKTLYYRVYYTR